MYLKNISIKINSSQIIELSFPKRISKFELEYTYVKGIMDKYFNVALRNIKYLENFETEKSFAYNIEERMLLSKILFVTDKNEKLSLRAIVKCCNKDYFLNLKLINKEGKVVDNYECPLSIEQKKIIHETFKLSTVEMKKKIEHVDNAEVFFFIPRDVKCEMENFFENSLCFFKDTNIYDPKDDWKLKSFVDRKYLEKLLNAYIEKKYGFNGIFENVLSDVVENSKFTLNVEKILSKMKDTNDKFCTFSFNSIVVAK